MPSAIRLLVLACIAATALAAAPGDVQTSFPAPCKYPAGLACDGTSLLVLDWRTASVYEISKTDGAVQRTFPAPTLKPHGLTCGTGKLFISDDRSGWVYAVNPQDATVTNSFQAPGENPTGLAYANDVLFILERSAARIYKVLPEDGTILQVFDAPTKTSTGLAHDGRYLWVSDRIKNELYLVDPDTGTVLSILDAPGPYPAGLACADGYLWNVDFQTRKIYQLTLHDVQKYRLTDTRTARIEYLWALYNYGPGDITNLTANLAIPTRLPNQELLSELSFTTPPASTATDRWAQACALYTLPTVPAGTRQELGYSVQAKVSAIRYLIFPHETGMLADIPAEIRAAYTVDGSRYRLSSPYIQETVKKIVGDEQNPYWIARKIYNFVIEHLEYQMIGGWDVPEVVLKRGTGSCSEYTFTFIALCRAAGLPARYQGSLVVRGDDASIDDAFHRWAQIYLPNYGWVPVDANRGDAKEPADQARGFGELSNRFLITTEGGGDSEYLAWGYNSFAKWQATGYCKVEEENLGFWEPLGPPASQPSSVPTETTRPSSQCAELGAALESNPT